MTAATAEPISVPCPECGRTTRLLPAELGRTLRCRDCATVYHVRRERRCRHDPLSARSRTLEDLAVGTPRPAAPEAARVLWFVGVLLLLAAATPLVVWLAPRLLDVLSRVVGAR